MPAVLNAMTIDLEDWAQGALDPRYPVTNRVRVNLDRVLTLLDRHHVRATFFALGKVCEAFPDMLPRIRDAGHEIGSHGYGHELIYHLSPELFAADVHLSIEVIETQTGRRPVGYRAPAFSITKASLWAGPILEEAGFRYSSSIFPIRKRRYGIADSPRFPHRWPALELLEFPITTLRWLGRNWPVCGGGYSRLIPAALMAHAIRRAHREGQPAVVYLHPYELAPGEVAALRREGFRVNWRRRLMQELWRSRVADRLSRLLREFEFAPMGEVLGLLPKSPQAEHPPTRLRPAASLIEV